MTEAGSDRRAQRPGLRTRPLADLSARELRPLLNDECGHWGEELLWEYGDVAAAVAAGLERRTLAGRVLQQGGRPVAYCYYMMDAGRAVVGSIYATAALQGQGHEEQLLDAVIADAQAHPASQRVECQTLFATASGVDGCFVRAGFKSRLRHYLVRSLTQPKPLPGHGYKLRPVRSEDMTTAGSIIYRSHLGSLDAALNMTYSTPALCRSFVETLVLRAGCGRFDADASVLAFGREGPMGVLIASRLSPINGHICQVSVVPEAQAKGLGSVLITWALESFRRSGLSAASLSVTVGNTRAYDLYQRLGFELRKPFAAHAWVRPPARIQLPA